MGKHNGDCLNCECYGKKEFCPDIQKLDACQGAILEHNINNALAILMGIILDKGNEEDKQVAKNSVNRITKTLKDLSGERR